MSTPVRDTSGFALPSHQSLALCWGTLGGSLLLWPVAMWGFPSPARFAAAWAAAGVGVLLLRRARRHWRLHATQTGGFLGEGWAPGALGEPAAAAGRLSAEVAANPQLRRLREVVENTSGSPQRRAWGTVTDATVADGVLTGYTVTTEKGALAGKGRAERCTQLQDLLDPGEDRDWLVVADPTNDTITGTLVNRAFPKAIAPQPPPAVVRDRQEAISKYPSTQWVLGVDAQGNQLTYPLADYPHVLVAGGTGGGKSVWARTTIESLRVRGFTCFISSGKESDFAGLEGKAGIAMVARDEVQTAVMVRGIRREMEQRNARAAAAKRRGAHSAFDFVPVLVLLDEWGATDITLRRRFAGKAEAFTTDLDMLLRVGREPRIHVVLLSQTIRKTGHGAVPGSWQENLKLTVSLGQPSQVTLLSDAFTEESRPHVRRIGSKLKGKQGRGLAVERETDRVVEFQSFYGWSPGTTSLAEGADRKVAPPTEEVRRVWERWVPVSESVPFLMPRVGIEVEGPDWVDGELDDVLERHRLLPVTRPDGTPIPERAKFDPISDQWAGSVSSLGTGSVIDFDDD